MATISQARQAVATALSKAELYRMWHTGFHAGLTHGKVLDAMGVRDASPAVEQLRSRLQQGTQRGRTIASIVQQHARLVEPFEGALLRFGEESGSLEASLKTLAEHFALEHRLLTRVWAKLTYPLITSFLIICIAPMPQLVAGNVATYLLAVALGVAVWYSFGGVVVSALAANYANRREFLLARLARTLAMAIEAGLPLDRAVVLAAESTGHPNIIAHVGQRSSQLQASQAASETFTGCPLIPAEMIAAMKVAEVSGDFSGSLRKLAELYDGR
ncbi:MAG: type II secretion system F family protein [Gemmatimonadota bacterium]